MDYKDHSDVINALKNAQESEHDMRIHVREAHHFLDHREGQWEPEIWNKFGTHGRPRYTFDQCNPVVDQISGEMEQADFDIVVKPAGGEANDDIAKTYDGLIRNIENISNAKDVFNAAGRSMVAAGLDGWMITQEWADSDSFDQDLFIRKIPNVVDRVWLDPAREMQSGADARYGFLLQVIPLAEYRKRWPDGGESSVSDDRESQVYSYKQKDTVLVGQFYYLEEVVKKLVRMTDGSVYEDTDEFRAVVDEKAQQGVMIEVDDEGNEKTRNRVGYRCMCRVFDDGGWLEPAKPTVFEYIPLVLTYGNFKISENKILYRGAIEKLLDPQRVLNYALSRDIEEGALNPRDKLWMTAKQAKGYEGKLSTLNTNADPVQFYNPDPDAPQGPYRPTSAQPNVALQTTAQNMAQAIQQAAGQPPVAKGDNPGLQSGIAIKSLQTKTDTQTIKWFKSQEVAIQHTAQILIKAIPKVYDTQRQVRILSEDGTSKMVTVNEIQIDQQTGQRITLQDLSQGKYDAVCSAGTSFVNRQEETVQAITEIAAIDPTIVQQGGDVLLKSIPSPGIDIIADRRRQQMLTAGMIPQSEWTDEEAQMMQQIAQQPKPPSPDEMIGQAELIKAQTEAENAQIDAQLKMIDKQQNQQKLDNENLKLQLEDRNQQVDMMFKAQQQQAELLTQAVNQMKTLTEAFGVDAIAGDAPAQNIIKQGMIIDQAQNQQ